MRPISSFCILPHALISPSRSQREGLQPIKVVLILFLYLLFWLFYLLWLLQCLLLWSPLYKVGLGDARRESPKLGNKSDIVRWWPSWWLMWWQKSPSRKFSKQYLYGAFKGWTKKKLTKVLFCWFPGYLWVLNKSFAYFETALFMQIKKITLTQSLDNFWAKIFNKHWDGLKIKFSIFMEVFEVSNHPLWWVLPSLGLWKTIFGW